jgi:MFS family permease
MSIYKSKLSILWKQVWALAGVQGAITLSWLVYNTYLPQLLIQFGFPSSLAPLILIIENSLAVIMEPLMGALSDQSQRKFATRFPLISLGVILSSTLLIAIPCMVTFVSPSQVFRGLLPLTLIAWSLTMTIFRSPALSLLIKYSMPSELPLAVSFITFAGGVVGAFRGVAHQFILSLGAIWSFAIASFVLLGTGLVLRFFHPPEIPELPKNFPAPTIPFYNLSLIFLTGFTMSWGSRLLMDTLGKTLKTQLSPDKVTITMLFFGLALALASLPAGFCASKFGNRPIMILGIIVTIISISTIIIFSVPTPFIILLIVSLIVGFSLITNGIIPFILQSTPPHWSGLGIGTYFGGFSLAMSLFGLLFSPAITPFMAGISAALAFSVSSICIFSTKIEYNRP